MKLMKKCTIMESLKPKVGRAMEVTPVDKRSHCDGIYMMERKLAMIHGMKRNAKYRTAI